MKKENKNNPFSFVCGFVKNKEVARAVATIDVLSINGYAGCSLLKWAESKKKWSSFDQDWPVVCIWEDETELYFMGPDGRIAYVSGGSDIEEYLDQHKTGPSGRGDMCDITKIGSHMFACGMGRQVYRRESRGKWVHVEKGLPKNEPLNGDVSVSGFNSIAGVDENKIVAVGFNGEIWKYEKNKWAQIDSPTNLILDCICFGGSKQAYACGQGGTILKGINDNWEIIHQETTEDDFLSMQFFNNELWLSTDEGIYKLDNENNLLNVTPKNIKTFGNLHANNGIMWSFGTKHIASTEDGVDWQIRMS